MFIIIIDGRYSLIIELRINEKLTPVALLVLMDMVAKHNRLVPLNISKDVLVLVSIIDSQQVTDILSIE